MIKKIYLVFVFFVLFSISPIVFAQESSLDINILKLNTSAIQKGYTISSFTNKFKVGIFPKVLSAPTEVVLKNFSNQEKIFSIPEDKKVVSHIYEFDIKNKKVFNNKKPLVIEIKYNSDYIGFRSIYYFNKVNNQWVLIPSHDLTGQKKIRANFYLPYAKFIVLENRGVMETGTASWYKWKNCDCAASPDYPKGTLLEVTNLNNGKKVIVTVNDYGPERDKFPNRVIDLDKVAFEKIANPKIGVSPVRVVPYKKNNPVITLSDRTKEKIIAQPIIKKSKKSIKFPFSTNAEAITIINAKTGEILYEKNGEEKKSIASLTKLMTAQVVLDLKPNWQKTIKYSKYDDDVTNYAGKWEMPYLNFISGEKIKVKDLFIASLLGSVSNATYTLYRSTGLLRRDFIEVMNRKAQELGMNNSHFTEPSGLDYKNISTTNDLVKLGRKIFNNFDILVATTSKKYSFSTNYNHYNLKTKDKILYSDLHILGTKTGYLNEAGKCLMVKADDKNGNQIIVATLGNFSQNRSDYFTEMEKLVKWGFKNINSQ